MANPARLMRLAAALVLITPLLVLLLLVPISEARPAPPSVEALPPPPPPSGDRELVQSRYLLQRLGYTKIKLMSYYSRHRRGIAAVVADGPGGADRVSPGGPDPHHHYVYCTKSDQPHN